MLNRGPIGSEILKTELNLEPIEPVFWRTESQATQTDIIFNLIGAYTCTRNLLDDNVSDASSLFSMDLHIPPELSLKGEPQAILLPPRHNYLPACHGSGRTTEDAIDEATENMVRCLSMLIMDHHPRLHPAKLIFPSRTRSVEVYMGETPQPDISSNYSPA